MEQKVGREGEGTREEGRSDEGGGGEEPGEVSESRGRHQANDVCIGEVCTCMYRGSVYMYVQGLICSLSLSLFILYFYAFSLSYVLVYNNILLFSFIDQL